MKKNSLYKVCSGCFSVLDTEKNDAIKNSRYALFNNTYGLVFLIYGSTKDRCSAYYFARGIKDGWNFRTWFPVGKIIEEENQVSIKTRYSYFVWTESDVYSQEQLSELKEWVKQNGDTYMPGFSEHKGIKEYFDL